VLLLAALGLLVALGAWGGFRLGRWSAGAPPPEHRLAEEPDAPMEDAGREKGEGFQGAVDLSSGFAVVYRRTASADEAGRARDSLAGQGFPVRIDQDSRRAPGDRFRVLVGPFPDREAALAAARRLDGAGGDPDLVFLE
jgi:cell division septation protein DedD